MEDLLALAVRAGEEAGAELVEARGEDITVFSMRSEKKTVKLVDYKRIVGVGVRVFADGATGYAYTNMLTREAVREAAVRAFRIAKAASRHTKLRLHPAECKPARGTFRVEVRRHPGEASIDEKKEALHAGEREAEEAAGRLLATTISRYGEAYGWRYLVSSDSEARVEFLVASMGFSVVCKEGGEMADAADSFGGTVGFEAFTGEHSPEVMGGNAARWALEKLRGVKPPVGKHRALVDNRLAGVLAHESFGHMSEYDFVATGGSPLAGKIGQRLGSSEATVVDEGVVGVEGYPGFRVPCDDEGVEARRVVILEEGVLRSYLHTRWTASLAGVEPTGNARAVDYTFEPICRMRNTYFTPGDLTLEEALEQLRNGVYACGTAGGQANFDGSFMFKATRGYLVEGGEVKAAFKDVAILGHILEFLRNIEAKTRELKVYSSFFGGCGKMGQAPLYVGLGGPHILVKEAMFGGERVG